METGPRQASDAQAGAFEAQSALGGAPSMRDEIFQHGPVAATFTVYEDFMS